MGGKLRMKTKIVADSSANLLTLDGVAFSSAPLVIRTDEREFVDDANLDVEEMVDYLKSYKGKSGTACPGVGDYLEAFEDCEEIYVITIYGVLSGSYNAAMLAKNQYEEEHPGRKVYVLDSRGTGPEMKLHIDKMQKLIQEGAEFEVVAQEVEQYRGQKTSILFCLESISNLANNGRVNPAVAKIANMLGIRVVGGACEEGISLIDKVRGEKKAIATVLRNMKEKGYQGGKVYIDHVLNEKAAETLKTMILAEYPDADIQIALTRGLCSFYAEKGGFIVGFEREL